MGDTSKTHQRRRPVAHDIESICLCVPEADFTCEGCRRKLEREQAETENDETPAAEERPPPPDDPLAGYGYWRADQDGYNADDEPDWCPAEEHKNAEFLTMIEEMFGGRVIDDG